MSPTEDLVLRTRLKRGDLKSSITREVTKRNRLLRPLPNMGLPKKERPPQFRQPNTERRPLAKQPPHRCAEFHLIERVLETNSPRNCSCYRRHWPGASIKMSVSIYRSLFRLCNIMANTQYTGQARGRYVIRGINALLARTDDTRLLKRTLGRGPDAEAEK